MSVIPPVDRIGSILPVSRRDYAQYSAEDDAQLGRDQRRINRFRKLKPKSTPTENAKVISPDTTCGQIVNTFALLG